MKIRKGGGTTTYGPGVEINLTGNEVAHAIDVFLYAQGIYVGGSRTIRVNGELCKSGKVYVDPGAKVFHKGKEVDGRTGKDFDTIKVKTHV